MGRIPALMRPGDRAPDPGVRAALDRRPAPDVLPRLWRSLVDAFLPARCASCRSFIRPEPKGPKAVCLDAEDGACSAAAHSLSSVVCDNCLKGFVPVESPLCTSCGVPFTSRAGDDHLCGDCLTAPRHFCRARAAAVYTPLMMALVQAFKYRAKVQLSQPLGRLLATAHRRFWPAADIDLVLPVPLHGGRFRHRGFNQAFLLIKEWVASDSFLMGGPAAGIIVKDAVVRIRPTPPQTGLGRRDRMRNIKKAFRVERRQVIAERRILLVDDVYTTGATVDECAKTLLRAGAARVDVLTLTRAV
ncbi:MAG: ComF family protein [Desulfobacterales bacterium]